MAKWAIPDNRNQKRIKQLEQALADYIETDDTPDDDPSVYGNIKRAAMALLEKGRPR
jgi:hypothetical protein